MMLSLFLLPMPALVSALMLPFSVSFPFKDAWSLLHHTPLKFALVSSYDTGTEPAPLPLELAASCLFQ